MVTGASGRGGAAICRALHARGLSIVIHHTTRSLAKAKELEVELEALRPGSTHLWQADFDAASEPASAPVPPLDVSVLICNASTYRPSQLDHLRTTSPELAVHLGAHAALLDAFGPAGRATLRSVVAITDIGVERAPPGYVAYTTAKGALQTMVLALANEWAPGVRCNVVQPGSLPFPDDWDDAERTRRIMDSIPLGRLGTFEELAEVVTFMALDASYVTGQVLAVDGGRSRQLV